MKYHITFDAFIVYNELKPAFPGVILLIRCKNVYKCFDEDAELVIKITGSKRSAERRTNRFYECSFSVIKTDLLISKIAQAGYRVGVCDPLDNCQQ